MKSIIEELWFGNICPQENGLSNTPELKELSKSMGKYHAELENTLNDEQKKLLEKLLTCRDHYEWKYEAEIFSCGFRLGAKLIMDL